MKGGGTYKHASNMYTNMYKNDQSLDSKTIHREYSELPWNQILLVTLTIQLMPGFVKILVQYEWN